MSTARRAGHGARRVMTAWSRSCWGRCRTSWVSRTTSARRSPSWHE